MRGSEACRVRRLSTPTRSSGQLAWGSMARLRQPALHAMGRIAPSEAFSPSLNGGGALDDPGSRDAPAPRTMTPDPNPTAALGLLGSGATVRGAPARASVRRVTRLAALVLPAVVLSIG